MNPYRFLSKILKVVTIAGPLVLFGGGLTSFWLPFSIAKSDKDKIIDNFTQTEIFQEVKAKDEAELDAMKKELDAEKKELDLINEKYGKGKVTDKIYLNMKNDYEQKLEEINSVDYIVFAMVKYDDAAYKDYGKALGAFQRCTAFGTMYTGLGVLATAYLEINAPEYWNRIDFAYDYKIDAYDEKKREETTETKELGD